MSRRTSSALAWLPGASNGISVTPNASANVFSNWTEVSSSLPSDIYVAFVMAIANNGGAGSAARVEIEVGVGTLGNEVAVARAVHQHLGSLQDGADSAIPLLLIKRIAAGSRVTVRMAWNVADTDPCFIALGYYLDPGGNTNVTTNTHVVTPSLTSGTNLGHTGAWTFGSWAEIIAAVSVNSYFTGFSADALFPLTDEEVEVQFGFGANPNETAFTTIAMNASTITPFYRPFRYPIWLPAGARLSVRSRASGSDTSWNCTVTTVPA